MSVSIANLRKTAKTLASTPEAVATAAKMTVRLKPILPSTGSAAAVSE